MNDLQKLAVVDIIVRKLGDLVGTIAVTLPGDPEQHVDDLIATFRAEAHDALMAATETRR